MSQDISDVEHPIAFLSRKLLPREQNYSTVEKECLAIVWAIDSLKYYLWMKDKNQRLLRWSLTLQQYDFEIKYRSGNKNANADALSRQNSSTVSILTWELCEFLILRLC